jgi:hypothetical protein
MKEMPDFKPDADMKSPFLLEQQYDWWFVYFPLFLGYVKWLQSIMQH